MRERNTSNFWQWLVSNPPFCQMCHDCFKSDKNNVGSSLTFAAWRANSNSIKKYDVIHDLMTYSFHFRLPLVHRYQGNVLSYFLFHFTDHSTLKKRFNNQFSLHFLYINFFYWSFWRTFFSLDTKKLFSNRRLDYFYFPVFVFCFFSFAENKYRLQLRITPKYSMIENWNNTNNRRKKYYKI